MAIKNRDTYIYSLYIYHKYKKHSYKYCYKIVKLIIYIILNLLLENND